MSHDQPRVLPPFMSTDQLEELRRDKESRMQRNIELIEQAYVDHEDFIADFDTVIRAQKAEQLTTKELTMLLTRLRERVFVFLLGPCGPERDAPFTIGG